MASLKLKLDKIDKKVQSKIRELGGLSHIDNPLQQVVVPIAEEQMDRGNKAVKALRKDDYKDRGDFLSQLPVKQPQRATLENLAERIQFEKLVIRTALEYSRFVGDKVEYDLHELEYGDKPE